MTDDKSRLENLFVAEKGKAGSWNVMSASGGHHEVDPKTMIVLLSQMMVIVIREFLARGILRLFILIIMGFGLIYPYWTEAM